MTFTPIAIPRDATELMTFDEVERQIIDSKINDARRDGRWHFNQDVPIDVTSTDFWSYWMYKSVTPIEHAEENSGIEERLEPFKRKNFALLPDDFEIESEVTLSACGDLMATAGLENSKDLLYELVADDIFGADIAYANLESTLTTDEVIAIEFSSSDTPKINLTPQQYQTLTSHQGYKYQVLQLANNHILDCGDEGIQTTLSQLDEDGIDQVGVNESQQDSVKAKVIEHNGLKIGWVAHTFSVNLKPMPEDKPWRVNVTPFHMESDPNLDLIEQQILACRNEGCEFVIAAFHWGLEFEFYPHRNQLKWARHLANLGADLIIGHHPHVAQPIEIYNPPNDPDKSVPILYSLGNLTPVISHPASVLSLIAKLRLVTGRYQGQRCTRVADVDLLPVVLLAENSVLKLVPVDQINEKYNEEFTEYFSEIKRYRNLLLGD